MITRRSVLRGFLGGSAVAVGLPWLEARAATCASGFPMRFGTFQWGNCNLPERWVPQGTGPDWTPSEQLAPLADLVPKVSVVSGLVANVPNISPHWSGAVAIHTGSELDGEDGDWQVRTKTIDQVVADSFGADTLYRSLEIGVYSSSVFSYAGPNAQNFGETDPFALYERLFGPTFREPGEGGLVDPTLGYRRSVLDAVMADIGALQSKLGSADRVRLEQHLDGVRGLEQRLARLAEDPPDLAACTRPGEPLAAYPDIDGRPQLSAKSRVFADLLAMSLACDQTRVFTFQHHPALSNPLFPAATDGHHNLTHNEGGAQPEVHAITLMVMEALAYLLRALDAVPEGDGTLLDHCCVLATSETSEGRTHRLDELPYLVAGGACGALVTGQHLRASNENVNKATLSILRALGLPQASLGEGDTYTEAGFSPLEAG